MLGLRVPEVAFFFSGFGESDYHPIEAFDKALMSAGVHEYNLVYYSSILPKDIAFTKELPETPRGTELPVVLSYVYGNGGEYLAAGLGRAIDKNRGGIVVETHAKGESPNNLIMGTHEVTLEEFKERTENLAIKLLEDRGFTAHEHGIIFSHGRSSKRYSCAVAGVAFVRFRRIRCFFSRSAVNHRASLSLRSCLPLPRSSGPRYAYP